MLEQWEAEVLQWIDSHCHLGFKGMVEEEDEIIARARAAGVSPLINVESASSLESNHAAVALTERHSDIYTVVGSHPHDAVAMTPETFSAIKNLGSHPKVVAFGEAGLDYHYDRSPRDVQQGVFRDWIRAAKEEDLPLVIHTREAEEDTLTILEEEGVGEGDAVIHCFTGSLEFAHACIQLGCYISIPGIVTFKNAGDVREVAKAVPDNRLLVETDSPFLTPVPFRGRRNEPSYVTHTAAFVAELRGVPLEELAGQTVENTKRFFRKMEQG